jgi:hypothetical protein
MVSYPCYENEMKARGTEISSVTLMKKGSAKEKKRVMNWKKSETTEHSTQWTSQRNHPLFL